MRAPRLVVIDTDCALGRAGEKVDDGFALALATASAELDIAAVTTTAGNVDLVTATDRTRALLRRLGRADVPVLAGGGPEGSAASRIIAELALADPGSVTVIALGPLTNVAAALADPRVGDALVEVVVLGGRFHGDDLPEFNTRCDPWAARAVLAGRSPVRLVSVDTSRRIALTPADLGRLASGGAAARYLAGHARARLGTLAEQAGAPVAACPMHDPLAVLAVTHPDVLRFAPALVQVRTDSPARGRTTAVTRRANPRATPPVPPEVLVAVQVDAAAAKEVLLARLGSLP